jgi:hypothetical protein
MTLSYWYYFLLLKWEFFLGSYQHFQEDFNALKYVLFGYCMNKLWILKVLVIASPNVWVGSTKTVIQHDLQLVYIYELPQYISFTAGLVLAYKWKQDSPGFKKTTL